MTFQGVFNIWLPRSGYKMDERYGLGIYHNIDRKIIMLLWIYVLLLNRARIQK